MTRFAKTLGIFAITFVSLALALLALLAIFGPGSALAGPGLIMVWAWFWSIFLHYRYCRRDELLHVLTTAAEAELPLAPALRAYLQDRPRGGVREFWVALLLFFVLPGYYWIWHRRHSYDRKVERLAHDLEQGVPLDRALRATMGMASRDMVLAAAIGQSTGRLGQALRGVAERRLSAAWAELLAPLGYPLPLFLGTLLFIPAILTFLMVFIIPKFQRIFSDFHMTLPAETQKLLQFSHGLVDYAWCVVLFVLLLALIGALVASSSTVRWFFPGIGLVYRQNTRRRVLQMLSILLKVGKPVPEAMALLEGMPLGVTIERRLADARYCVEQGEPLAESLWEVGLLPASMVPLVHAAERVGHLPWALAELAESIRNRTIRAIGRVTMTLFPAAVVAVGALVAFIVLALFLPLIKMITELSA